MTVESAGFWNALERELIDAGVSTGPLQPSQALGGGCLHHAVRVEAPEGPLLVKQNDAGCAAMFAAEADGLEAMASAQALRVPRPRAHGVAAGRAYIATEFVELSGNGDAHAFGERLARLHANRASAFGFARDNWIGTTPQPNGWMNDWIAFWRERRLGHQLELARADGHERLWAAGQRLLERLPAFFADYDPAPALLHGDLWAGNYAYDREGIACLFDPAAYYGDREADLAMTELFGGFPPAFYSGYEAVWPRDAGYPVRKRLYNLYHVLNHAHLFGGPYPREAQHGIERLLAELDG